MTDWELYRSVCEALERLSLLPRYSEGLEPYLSEANPDVWEGEVSADPVVYEDFRGFISMAGHERLSLFGLIRLYFSTLDDHYSDSKRIINSLSEKDFADALAEADGLIDHRPSLADIVHHLDSVLLSDVTFPAFKDWSCRTLPLFLIRPSEAMKDFSILQKWQCLNGEIGPQNASRKKMIDCILEFKEELIKQRFAFLSKEAIDIGDRIGELERMDQRSESDNQEYVGLLSKLGALGDFEAYNALGSAYYTGRCGTQDFAKAAEFYLKASEMGSTQALINYGYICYYARCGGDPDYETALSCFQKASKIGDSEERIEALYKLSDMYDRGYAVKRNRKKAYRIIEGLYRDAASSWQNPGQGYLGDLAIRLAKAHSPDGFFPNLRESLRYYLQAQYLIKKRWDGKWFGDKSLLDSCGKAIPSLQKAVFPRGYPGNKMNLSIFQCAEILLGPGRYALKNLIYDEKRRELYCYLRSWEVKTLEYIPFSGEYFDTCLVFRVKSAMVHPWDFLRDGIIRNAVIDLEDISNESWPKRWRVEGTKDGDSILIAEFAADFKARGYIAYVKDFSSGQKYYEDPRYAHPAGYEARKVFRFFIEYGFECMWPQNDEADEYCHAFGSEVDAFPFSDELKADIYDACSEYEKHGMSEEGDSEYWTEDQWGRFRREVEAPLAARAAVELGPDFLILHAGQE